MIARQEEYMKCCVEERKSAVCVPGAFCCFICIFMIARQEGCEVLEVLRRGERIGEPLLLGAIVLIGMKYEL